MRIALAPCKLADAKLLVALWHSRHPLAGAGHMWSTMAVASDNDVGYPVGVVIVGRPVARALDDGWTVEITRCATPGIEVDPRCKDVASRLYAAATRAAKERGFARITTMTEADEHASSLRAAGWTVEEKVRPARKGWTTRNGSAEAQPARRRWWGPLDRPRPSIKLPAGDLP